MNAILKVANYDYSTREINRFYWKTDDFHGVWMTARLPDSASRFPVFGNEQ
jgi:hypothetical protein